MAAKKEDIIDVVYGVEILEKINFERLTVLPPHTPIVQEKEYSFNNRKIKVLNDKYISSYDKAKGDITLGKINEKYRVPVLFPRKLVELPDQYTTLKDTLIKLYASTGRISIYPDICSENLAGLLSFFTIYPDFGPVYEEYLLSPDNGVTLVDKIEVLGPAIPGRLITNDVKATAHLLLLSIVKNFKSETATTKDLVKQYLENRLKALHFVLGDQNAKFLLNTTNIDHMLFIWNSYPKLKSAVFYFAIAMSYQTDEMKTAITLIAEYSIITISSILKFIRSDQKVIAHIDPVVADEVRNFLKECAKLKQELGQLWPFYKIIRENDTTLSAYAFPNLSKVAAVYVKEFLKEHPYYQGVIEPNCAVDAALREAAKLLLDNRFVDEGVTLENSNLWLTTEEIKLSDELASDINKWRCHRTMRSVLKIDVENEQPAASMVWF